MGVEYAKVLAAQKVDFDIVGRGEANIKKIQLQFPNVKCFAGGIENHFKTDRHYTHAIIATSVLQLFSNTDLLLVKRIKNILVEKPCALFLDHLQRIEKLAQENNASVFVAYNRRFYKSVELAENIIREDGGISSIAYEFTEWVHTIDTEKFDKLVLKKWIHANSSHVIDLAFYLAGRPKVFLPIVRGSGISWHPSGSIFIGTGITEKNIPFTYHSNWLAPGRWAVEVMTNKHRLYFKPMEKLMVQNLGSVVVNDVEADYSIDTDYKAGVYNQVKFFLDQTQKSPLCSLAEHIENFKFYEKIGEY